VYDSGTAAGHLYYIMPFVDGESLRDRLARDGPLTIDDAIHLLRDLSRALAYAHRHGVVHRDIKPENVLLNRDGDALVADFGVAKALVAAVGSDQQRPRETLSAIRLVIGTPAYMAPEQALGDPETDHRADLYALGVVAYEVLGGASPFVGRTAQALMTAHLSECPKPIDVVRPDVPLELGRLVMHLLSKAPAERPQEAAQVLRALGDVRVAAEPRVVARPTHRARISNAILGASAFLVVAVVAWRRRLAGRPRPVHYFGPISDQSSMRGATPHAATRHRVIQGGRP
jgi:serine/threonine-protein kinase